MISTAFRFLVDFLFPKESSTLLIESLAPHSLLAKLPQAKDINEDTVAIWNYAFPEVRTLIWELKYRKNEKIIENLSIILFDIIKSELEDRILFENFDNPLLIPMPMSSERRLERGFNQTEVLALALKKLDTENILELDTNLLSREERRSQTLVKNKKDRAKNVENSFKIMSNRAKDRNIILLDDVTTTGATFRDARRTLRESGAKKILSIAIAH